MKTSGVTVDENIAILANRKICDVVFEAENRYMQISFPEGNSNASKFLVSRLFTDAVFNQDIRAIQLIINRIDGGLPKDTEIDNYQTMFGDCLAEVMSSTRGDQLKVYPTDTVMMSLCKSLYSIATEDIYHRWDENRECFVKHRPTDAQKRERDAALRMVLERSGGRKTLNEKAVQAEAIEVAPWIAELSDKSTC